MARIRSFVHPSELDKPADEGLKKYLKLYSDNLYDASFAHGELAVRERWPDRLIQGIVAAGISSQLGIGLEYALKKYVRVDGAPEFRRKERLDEDVETCINHYDYTFHKAYGFPKGDGSPAGEFFAGMSLMKALATLQSAHHLAQLGYLLEPMVLIRSAIEMLAWSRTCQDLEEDGPYLKLTTNEAIVAARATLPTLPKLYGLLSKFAHWHPDVHLSFMTSYEGVGVISKSLEYKTCALLAVASSYVLSFCVFCSLMKKYWPDRDFQLCREAIEELVTSGTQLREKTGDWTRMKSLVTEFDTCMKETYAHIEK